LREKSENITGIACCNATGQFLPPVLLYSRTTTRNSADIHFVYSQHLSRLTEQHMCAICRRLPEPTRLRMCHLSHHINYPGITICNFINSIVLMILLTILKFSVIKATTSSSIMVTL